MNERVSGKKEREGDRKSDKKREEVCGKAKKRDNTARLAC